MSIVACILILTSLHVCKSHTIDKVEQTAEVAIEVVEKVAEAAEKIADDVSEAFPGNDNLKKAASRIKAVADEIEKDAEKAKALIEKVRLTAY